MVDPKAVLLLVEDDPADVRLIQRAMQKVDLPAQLTHAKDGDVAVAYLSGEGEYADRSKHPLPWLMLMDIKLPRRSGLEVLQWVRQQPGSLASTPVIMFSSSSHGVDINTAYQYGANSYLVKPESSHQLESMLSVVKAYWFMHNQLPRRDEPPLREKGVAR